MCRFPVMVLEFLPTIEGAALNTARFSNLAWLSSDQAVTGVDISVCLDTPDASNPLLEKGVTLVLRIVGLCHSVLTTRLGTRSVSRAFGDC